MADKILKKDQIMKLLTVILFSFIITCTLQAKSKKLAKSCMTCTGCKQTIQTSLEKIAGVKVIEIDHTTGKALIEVKDGIDVTNESLFESVKKAGYKMAVSGTPPFSVVLGKHDVVSVSLNGEPVDISGYPKNRLAKFKLPLAE